jgi:predicted nucleic acid-binding protein
VALNARYLADKSALARFPHPVVEARLRTLLEDGLIATCAIVDLEVLFSSRRLVDYEAVLLERRSLDSAPITPGVLDLAIDLQHELAKRGQHRLAIPDLIISAAARSDSSSCTTTPTSNGSGPSAAPNTSGSLPGAASDPAPPRIETSALCQEAWRNPAPPLPGRVTLPANSR